MASNAALPSSLAEILADLGGISTDRIRIDPAPGRATMADVVSTSMPVCAWSG